MRALSLSTALRHTVCIALVILAPMLAHAGMGMAELPGLQGDGPVTLFFRQHLLSAPQ